MCVCPDICICVLILSTPSLQLLNQHNYDRECLLISHAFYRETFGAPHNWATHTHTHYAQSADRFIEITPHDAWQTNGERALATATNLNN